TTFVFDALNRVIQQTDPLHKSATFAFDAAGRMSSTTDRDGRRRDFGYDAHNRKTSETWVVAGSTVNNLTFSYDAVGNQLSAADSHGAWTMTYDSLNRVATTKDVFNQALTFSYD